MNPFRTLGQGLDEGEQRARVTLLADAGDVRSLVELLPFLPPETHRLGPEAASAATSILMRSSPLELAWFDQWYRAGWNPKEPRAPAWDGVRLGSLPWAQQFRGVVALASFHANGFVREVAVRLLSEFEDGFELPYLLIRTNDWVPKVRVAAAMATLKRVTPAYIGQWLRCLGLLARLRAAQRREQGEALYLHRVEALLLHEDAREPLASALSSHELPVRREVLRLALLLSAADRRRLLTIAVEDTDPLIAHDAAKGLLSSAMAEGSPDVITQLSRHRLGRVRNLALTTALEQRLPSAIAWLERAVFDEARCVRESGRYHLSKLAPGQHDFTAMYRKRASEGHGRERVVAIEGLAEIGTRDDLALFLQLLHAPSARLRAAAIVGIGRCAGEAHHDALEGALRDHSSLVRRAATPFAKLYLGRGVVLRVRRDLRATPA